MNVSQKPHRKHSPAAQFVTLHLNRSTALFGPSISSTSSSVKKILIRMSVRTQQTLKQQEKLVHQHYQVKETQPATLNVRALGHGLRKLTMTLRSFSASCLVMIFVTCCPWRISGRSAGPLLLWSGTTCQARIMHQLSILGYLIKGLGQCMNVHR